MPQVEPAAFHKSDILLCLLHGQDLGSLLGGKLEKACLEISGLRLGTGSPTPMMETPMGNQTFNSGLCAGTESEL